MSQGNAQLLADGVPKMLHMPPSCR